MATDPVCGTQVDAGMAEAEELSSEHQGTVYYFCSAECKQAFEDDPQSFVNRPPE